MLVMELDSGGFVRVSVNRVMWVVSVLLFLAGAVLLADAQTPAGTVSGRVSLSDTNGPARFAHVLLKKVPDGTAKAGSDSADDLVSMLGALMGGDDEKPKKTAASPSTPGDAQAGAKGKKDDADETAAMGAFASIMSSAGDMLTSAVVDASGTYTLSGVKPGTYFIHAVLPGYVDPLAAFSAMDLASKDPVMQAKVKAAVPTITVTGTGTVHQDLRLELGAAISGRVLYDDGSPAVGWKVSVAAPKEKPGLNGPRQSVDMGFGVGELPSMTEMVFKESHTTDDRGNYRVAGLVSGDYVVSAVLTTENASAGSALKGGQMRLAVMSGNVTNEADAKPVNVGTGEDHKGVDLVMPLTRLHTIAGMVLAKADGKAANSGSVTLRDDSETSVLKMQLAAVQADGSFRFDYVPNGHYTLKVKQAGVTETTGATQKVFGMEIPDEKTLRSFGPDETKVEVSDRDVSGVMFSLPDVPVPEKKVKLGK